jgi:Tfp pilus assembly protein PilF
MKRAFTATTLSILLLMVIIFGCRSAGDTSKAETQKQFGVRMAKMNLWREAMFRFKRAIEIDPNDAMAHNNLAVSYEANGDFDDAAREYREALRLDRGNQYIQKNYSRFVEFTQKAKKRQTTGKTASSDTITPAATPPVTVTTSTTGTMPPSPPMMLPPPTDTTATTVTAPPPPRPPDGDMP